MQMTVSLRTLALGTVALLMMAPGRAQTGGISTVSLKGMVCTRYLGSTRHLSCESARSGVNTVSVHTRGLWLERDAGGAFCTPCSSKSV